MQFHAAIFVSSAIFLTLITLDNFCTVNLDLWGFYAMVILVFYHCIFNCINAFKPYGTLFVFLEVYIFTVHVKRPFGCVQHTCRALDKSHVLYYHFKMRDESPNF